MKNLYNNWKDYWQNPSLFQDTVFDWSCSEHSEGAKSYMFADTQCLNKTRPDESLHQPRQHEIDPSYNSVVAMCVNESGFYEWCLNELSFLGIDDVKKAGFKGLADAVLRCIPTAKLLKEMDMYSTYKGDDDENN
tara:strand:+ start:1161 stop:1565 length:405 start_codon:yes stop_codon:yes gene_type:complete